MQACLNTRLDKESIPAAEVDVVMLAIGSRSKPFSLGDADLRARRCEERDQHHVWRMGDRRSG